jgi:hypothetical protein
LISRWKSTEKSLREEMLIVKDLATSVDELRGGEPSFKKSSSANDDERMIKPSSIK